jgi:hypothetical protein
MSGSWNISGERGFTGRALFGFGQFRRQNGFTLLLELLQTAAEELLRARRVRPASQEGRRRTVCRYWAAGGVEDGPSPESDFLNV